MSDAFALYVHFPWCRHVCPYCDFNVYALARPPEAGFVATLAAELQYWAQHEHWQGRPVRSVYLGGGTPSMFSAAGLGTVLTTIDVAFGIAPDAEITLEANPGTLTAATLVDLRQAGVNRLSIGAQSFHPQLLRTLGRDHGPDDTRAAVAGARAAGFTNLSLDLIFAVPGQTLDDWRADLHAALALAPDHVSAYCLTYEHGTPFHAWRASGRIVAAPDDDEAAMLDLLVRDLAGAGLERYEISSWARPGFGSRHNQQYWDGSDYLGIGPGAHSFCRQPAPGVRFANERLPDAYRAAVERKGTAVAVADHLTAAQARADFVITGLRRIAGVDAVEFLARFDQPLDMVFPQLEQLVRDGLVIRDPTRLRLSARGLLFADTVCAAFV